MKNFKIFVLEALSVLIVVGSLVIPLWFFVYTELEDQRAAICALAELHREKSAELVEMEKKVDYLGGIVTGMNDGAYTPR